MIHWSELPMHVDMAPYAAFYQGIVREIGSRNHVARLTTRIVEAGVRYGCSARIIMEAMADYKKWHLHLIDPFPKPEAIECENENKRVLFHPDTAEAAAVHFSDRSIDILHIDVDLDGTHPYELTRAVVDAFMPKLKPSSNIIFHDCTDSFPGVKQCVDELVATGEWKACYCNPAPLCPIAAPAVLRRIV